MKKHRLLSSVPLLITAMGICVGLGSLSHASAAQTRVFFQVINTGDYATGYATTGTDIVTGGATSGTNGLYPTTGEGFAGGRNPSIFLTGFGSATDPSNTTTTTGAQTISGRVAGPYISGDLELYSGYKWAFEQGITYRTGFNEIALYGTPTRADLAKMIAIFATQTLGKPIPPVEECDPSHYKDFSAMTGNESFYIKQACELGLMGWKNDKSGVVELFQPHALVTRITLAAVLSRLLYGDQYNKEVGEQWYSNHLKALNEAGFLRKIDTPFSYERFGYIMLIMKRIAEAR